MKKQIYLCVDMTTLMQQNDLQVQKQAKGTLSRDSDEHFTFTERGAHPHEAHPELHWHPIAGSLHGKVSVNANGSMLILYLRHPEYNTNARQLADIIVSEAEQIGEALADINLVEEVAKCGR